MCITRAADKAPDELVLIFQKPAGNWLIYPGSPHCIKKMPSHFAFGRNSYLEVLFCAHQTLSGSRKAPVLGPAGLTPSSGPFPLLSQSGEPVHIPGGRLCSCSFLILPNFLSKHRSAYCAHRHRILKLKSRAFFLGFAWVPPSPEACWGGG